MICKAILWIHTVKWSKSSISDNSVKLVIYLHSLYISNSSIWAIDRNLSGATTPVLSGSGSDGIEGVIRITRSSGITELYHKIILCHIKDTRWGWGSYIPVLMQPVYSTTPANWANM